MANRANSADEQPTVRLTTFGSLSASEMDDLRHAAGDERHLHRGETLWNEGDRLPGLFLLLDGWMASATGDGPRRRMFKAHLAGDVLGLPSLAFKAAIETAIALTPVSLRPIPLHSFGHLFEAQPRVAAMLFLVSQQERVDLVDRLASVARDGGKERVAALVLKLHRRVSRSRPGMGDTFHLPLAKRQMADLAGVSIGGLNAALAELKDANVLGWSAGLLTILDRTALTEIAHLPSRDVAHDPYWLPSSE